MFSIEDAEFINMKLKFEAHGVIIEKEDPNFKGLTSAHSLVAQKYARENMPCSFS